MAVLLLELSPVELFVVHIEALGHGVYRALVASIQLCYGLVRAHFGDRRVQQRAIRRRIAKP